MHTKSYHTRENPSEYPQIKMGRITMKNRPITALRNIGKTVATRLHEIGVSNEDQLKKMGSAKAYKWLSLQSPEKRLPVCYYLYSLEGAIRNIHWDELTEKEKAQLRMAAGLSS